MVPKTERGKTADRESILMADGAYHRAADGFADDEMIRLITLRWLILQYPVFYE